MLDGKDKSLELVTDGDDKLDDSFVSVLVLSSLATAIELKGESRGIAELVKEEDHVGVSDEEASSVLDTASSLVFCDSDEDKESYSLKVLLSGANSSLELCDVDVKEES